MRRSLALVLTLTAWLLATGSQWDVVQTFAWARMFAENVRTLPLRVALDRTFSPEGRCGVCAVVTTAKQSQADSPDTPATPRPENSPAGSSSPSSLPPPRLSRSSLPLPAGRAATNFPRAQTAPPRRSRPRAPEWHGRLARDPAASALVVRVLPARDSRRRMLPVLPFAAVSANPLRPRVRVPAVVLPSPHAIHDHALSFPFFPRRALSALARHSSFRSARPPSPLRWPHRHRRPPLLRPHPPAPDVVQLDPVVTTVARGTAPLIVTADPKAPAQPAPAHDGADVLKNIPGFSVIRKGGTDGDPVLRGLAGSRLGIQVDGETIYGGCGNRMDPPTAYVFPAAYDRITVVKGPQSVLHGPGNSAGVVPLRTPSPPPAAPENSLFASTTAGSFGRFDAALDARVAAPSAQARLSATTTRADDYTDGSGRSVHSAYDRWSANASAAWTPDAHTVLEFSSARSDGEAAYADRAMDGVKFARENYGLRFTRTALSPLLASAEARVFSNYVDHVMDNFSRRTFTPSTMMPGRAVSNPDRLTTGGLAQLVLTPAAPARVTVGLDTQRNTHSVRSTSNELTAPSPPNPASATPHFSKPAPSPNPPLRSPATNASTPAPRLDHWRATDERTAVALSMMSTAANPGRQPPPHQRSRQRLRPLRTRPRLLRRHRLRRPRPHPTFPGLLGNREKRERRLRHRFGVRPETTTQLDIGTLYRRGPVRFTVSAFASQIVDYLLVQSNVVKTSTTPAMPGMGGMTTTSRTATITRNVDASTWGGEADLGLRLADHWNIDASLAFVRGENDTDSLPLAQLPPLESRIGLSYTQPVWSAGTILRLVSAQDRVAVNQGNIVGQDLGRSAGFGVLALHASWRATAHTRLSAGVDNALDRTYAEHISRAGSMVPGFIQTTRVNEPGRFLWLKLDLSL